jgi:class 3 adenylate cyclase
VCLQPEPASPSDKNRQPGEAPAALRSELARSIERTLTEEARNNELTIAAIRVFTLVGAMLVELWLLSGPSAMGEAALPFALITGAYTGAALGCWGVLRRGYWSPWLSAVLPVLDTAYMALRVGGVFVVTGREHVIEVQELATITAMASLLAVSGAYRLDPRAVAWTTALGIALYGAFAHWIGLPLFHASVHLVLIAAIGLAGFGLTRLVRRAVHSEVTRLTLRRLLPAPVIDAADSDPMALLTEPRSLEATVVVTDLRGFTAWAEHRTPLEVLGMLNQVQGALAAIVDEHGGTVDKFMGDGMLAVFGAPRPEPNHADHALAAVARMCEVMSRFDGLRPGIGVHSGEVVVGCVGSGIRMEFTVVGDTVNTASRLEAATKDHGVPVLISDSTQKRTRVLLAAVGELAIRGRQERLMAWTLPLPT